MMRWLGLFLSLLCSPAWASDLLSLNVGGAANSPFVATSNCSAVDTLSSTPVSCVLANGIGGATVVVVFSCGNGNTASTVSDGTNTYSSLVNVGEAGIYYKLNPASVAAGGSVTVTCLSASTSKYIHVVSLNKIAAVDQSGSGSGISSTPSCTTGGSVAAGAAAFGLVTMLGSASTGTQASGWSGAVQGAEGVNSVADGNKISAGGSTETYNPTSMGSGIWGCAIGSFK